VFQSVLVHDKIPVEILVHENVAVYVYFLLNFMKNCCKLKFTQLTNLIRIVHCSNFQVHPVDRHLVVV